jgi:hypothetical protein
LVGTAQARLCPPYGFLAMTARNPNQQQRKHDT